LRPIFGDVKKIFDIEIDLFEESPLGFNHSQVVFSFGFAAFSF
jgi:hypothetical protein